MRILLVAIFLLFPAFASETFSQQTGGRLIMLEGDEYANQPDERARKLTRKGKIPANVIKVALLSPFRGDYSIIYERRIQPWLSIQGGLGITTRDKVYERLTSGTFSNDEFKASPGFSAKLGARLYPISDGWMSGTFFSPDFVYREYHLDANLTQFDLNNNPSPQRLRCGYSFREYRLLVGQSYDFLFKNLYLEYYFGLVFRETFESLPLFQNSGQGSYYTRMDNDRFSAGIAFNVGIGYAF